MPSLVTSTGPEHSLAQSAATMAVGPWIGMSGQKQLAAQIDERTSGETPVVSVEDGGEVQAQVVGAATLKDRGDCPVLTTAGSRVSVVPGVGGQQHLDMWHAELASWIADWSPQRSRGKGDMASCCAGGQ